MEEGQRGGFAGDHATCIAEALSQGCEMWRLAGDAVCWCMTHTFMSVDKPRLLLLVHLGRLLLGTPKTDQACRLLTDAIGVQPGDSAMDHNDPCVGLWWGKRVEFGGWGWGGGGGAGVACVRASQLTAGWLTAV
jgi:hypothetical protein